MPLDIVQSQTIGPWLGQDSIDEHLLAGAMGLGIVALFMILYSVVQAQLAVLALLIYTAVTFAIFELIPVTLTLAGIASFVLSIGMAVDANVLIFARRAEGGDPAAGGLNLRRSGQAWVSITRGRQFATPTSQQ